MKLSLCIATFNEEKNIHYPLDSAYDMVDEVVIVDGGSTDKTVEKAFSYGKKIRIIQSDNPKMFHKNKQKAIEAAKGEWILQLDADEELSEELKNEISQIVMLNSIQHPKNEISKPAYRQGRQVRNDNPVAYWLPRKNWFLTRFLDKGGQYPDYTIRLYKNGMAKFPCKDVHENVEIIPNGKSQMANPNLKSEKFDNGNIENTLKTENGKLKIGFLTNPLLHYADPEFSRYLQRWDRYTSLEVDRMSKDEKLSFLRYFCWLPKKTFFLMYFRHKGFMDGFPGFVFALFSSIRFWVIYIKWKQKFDKSKINELKN